MFSGVEAAAKGAKVGLLEVLSLEDLRLDFVAIGFGAAEGDIDLGVG